MVRCPKCGAEVADPVKTWEITSKGNKSKVIELFKCPNGHYFVIKKSKEQKD